MFEAGLIVIFLGVTLLLSHKQWKSIYTKYTKSTPVATEDQEKKEKNSSIYGNDEPLPRPTPLMITPEQVENYDDRPWRPFRWPYHQTMSIYKLDINHWLDMDKYYIHYYNEKQRIRLKYGKENFASLPEGMESCVELMEVVVDHLVARYPLLFTVLQDDETDWTKGKIIRNEITKETLDMTLPLKEHPLVYVSKLAKEDFYFAKKNPEDGLHYLVAAGVAFPGGSFDVSAKLGKHLDQIHEEVPYYREKLRTSMERWFNRMKPNEPVERASWYISWDTQLRVNNIYQIPKFKPNLEADMKSTSPKQFNVRVERQTLRMLPKTKTIIFTNHPTFYSIEEMKDEPMIPSLIKKIMFEAQEKIIKYKNFEFIRDHLADYLDGLIQRQKDLGIITDETPLKTQKSYPFAHWVKTDFDYVNGWNNPSPSYSKEHRLTESFNKDNLADNE
ncbi:hypothetical protein JA1_002134 [Spathaspora sp. JA1]|nr:hypothetical protein JA1_002134 [Spathaspora sp. JA1]